ncbi:MAG: hypothetical protein Kow0059_02180 [Candidatus Sumerlaeia bacterium]
MLFRLHQLSALILFSAIGLALAAAPGRLPAQPAWFVLDGRLIRLDSPAPGEGPLTTSRIEVRTSQPVYEYLGVLNSGDLLVSLGTPTRLDSMISDRGVDIAVVTPDGELKEIVWPNAVRAYAAPAGNRIAIITLDYRLIIKEGATVRTPPLDARVTLAAWSPDGSQLCVTGYPPDWTPHLAHNPPNTDEFLRLMNSDLWLVNVADDGAVRRLTDSPGFDYSGVFYPDGRRILFISSRDGRGAFFRLSIETGETVKLTNHTPGSYDVPVGRSDSFLWAAQTGEWIYSAQEADTGADSIRALSSDGARCRLLGLGRQPRLTGQGAAVAFIAGNGKPAVVPLER